MLFFRAAGLIPLAVILLPEGDAVLNHLRAVSERPSFYWKKLQIHRLRDITKCGDCLPNERRPAILKPGKETDALRSQISGGKYMKHPVDEHRLLLQGARNLRDLGGYRTEDGRVTRKGLFFRSDSTARLTDEDIRAIRDAGVSLAVDLRSPSEAEHSPSRLRGVMGIDYRVVPLYDGIHSAMFEGKLPDSLGEMYIELLEESKERMAELFRLFLAATGASLFHLRGRQGPHRRRGHAASEAGPRAGRNRHSGLQRD